MKKMMICMLLAGMALGVTACGGQKNENAQQAQQEATTQDTATPTVTTQAEANTAAVTATPSASAAPSGTVTEDEAKQTALQDAGLAEADVTNLLVKSGIDDGVQEYEVNFYANGYEYDYDIDAATGAIRSKDMEAEPAPQSNGAEFTQESAIAAVLEKVPGATEENVRIKLDEDDGVMVYEGDVLYNGSKYEFEIDASTGAIRSWEMDD